jgi:glutamine amidotransferase
MMIAIVDYGMGNLRSVQNAFESLGFHAVVTHDAAQIKKAEKVVLPGVGAFGDCMKNLQEYKLKDVVQEAAYSSKPFLGICLGLQALFEESEEGGKHKGFGIIPGRVRRFNGELKIPHMGWNQIRLNSSSAECPLLKGIEDGSFFYFVHSFYGISEDKAWVTAETEYGCRFTSMVWKNNLFATQFHPEKSQAEGLKILKNFATL